MSYFLIYLHTLSAVHCCTSATLCRNLKPRTVFTCMFFITNMLSTCICVNFTQGKSGKSVLLQKCLQKLKLIVKNNSLNEPVTQLSTEWWPTVSHQSTDSFKLICWPTGFFRQLFFTITQIKLLSWREK